MAKPTGRPIRSELLETARHLIQTRGIGEFSYGTLAAAAGIKAPSIHHHFPRKDQLVAEIAGQYRGEFADLLNTITAASAVERIVEYSQLYAATARSGRSCLCGAIAAEWSTVGEPVREVVDTFFAEQVEWLRDCVADGQQQGEIRQHGVDPATFARALFAHLQGALLLARSDDSFIDMATTTREMLRHLAGGN
jgi:TetR/AcrR family transcriptional regulator, transcriptional repressor for nem operon